MSEVDTLQTPPRGGIHRILAERQDVVLIAPLMVYLVLLGLRDQAWLGLDYDLRIVSNIIRGIGAFAVFQLVRPHLPDLGKPHWEWAIPAGILAAIGWIAGQHLFNDMGVPTRLPLPLFTGEFEAVDPRDQLGAYKLFWATVVSRIAVAALVVPIVEELFWRGFMLRAFIDWSNFEKVPLGKFTWWSFLGTSLVSTVQHPDNWLVSIFCWMFFNLLFYWKPSLSFIMIVHGVTNLALYVYVVQANDWIFW